MGQSQNTAVS